MGKKNNFSDELKLKQVTIYYLQFIVKLLYIKIMWLCHYSYINGHRWAIATYKAIMDK